jgi:hypothetical protein
MTAGRFNGHAKTENLDDGVNDRLLAPLAYVTRDGLWTIEAPAGFVTDYASIPRLLWAVIPPRGKYNRAAITHDLLYRLAPADPRTGRRVTQAAADAVMLEAMEDLGVRWTQRYAIWAGLRLGGWVTWRRYRGRDEAAPATCG